MPVARFEAVSVAGNVKGSAIHDNSVLFAKGRVEPGRPIIAGRLLRTNSLVAGNTAYFNQTIVSAPERQGPTRVNRKKLRRRLCHSPGVRGTDGPRASHKPREARRAL